MFKRQYLICALFIFENMLKASGPWTELSLQLKIMQQGTERKITDPLPVYVSPESVSCTAYRLDTQGRSMHCFLKTPDSHLLARLMDWCLIPMPT